MPKIFKVFIGYYFTSIDYFGHHNNFMRMNLTIFDQEKWQRPGQVKWLVREFQNIPSWSEDQGFSPQLPSSHHSPTIFSASIQVYYFFKVHFSSTFSFFGISIMDHSNLCSPFEEVQHVLCCRNVCKLYPVIDVFEKEIEGIILAPFLFA